ncbi:hypothetical protein D3C87_559150 [compost metagenome]
MSRKLHTVYCPAGNVRAVVAFKSSTEEFTVKFFQADGTKAKGATYFTSDDGDAIGTAEMQVRRTLEAEGVTVTGQTREGKETRIHAVPDAATEAKAEAIANADAHTNNAALPTYTELADALGALCAYIRADLENNNPEWAPLDIAEYASAAALLERLPA